jgi:hypothetical protein
MGNNSTEPNNKANSPKYSKTYFIEYMIFKYNVFD